MHPISALQSEYSLWERNLEAGLIPFLRELGIGLVAFAPLGRGFLTGTVKRAEEYSEGDYRRGDPRYQGENFDANVRAAGSVRDLAARKGATPAQIALAWLLHEGSRHRADPRHQAAEIPGGEHWCGRRVAQHRGDGRAGRSTPAGEGLRPALRPGADEAGGPLSGRRRRGHE